MIFLSYIILTLSILGLIMAIFTLVFIQIIVIFKIIQKIKKD